MTRAEEEDLTATYHKFARAGLAAAAPGFDWEAYFTAIGMPAAATHFIVRQPGFFKEVAVMSKTVPLACWKTYLCWRLIDDSASKLSANFENEHFAWNGGVIQGLKEPGPRWRRVEEVVEQGAGFTLGRLYVERASSTRAKRKALEIFENLRAAFGERIRTLDWMSPGTKESALEKLAAMGAKIGYPDEWPDDSGLTIDRGSYVLNWMRANAFNLRRGLAKLGKAGRPRRVVADAADRSRRIRRFERYLLSGRRPATAFRPRRGRRRELRQPGRRHGPRNDPRVRRPGPQV